MKNRTIIGVICIALSIAVMFGISPVMNKMSSGKIELIQVNKQIKQGQMITVDDLEKVTIGSYGIKDGVIKDESTIIGKYAKSDIYPNIYLYPEMLCTKADSAEDVFENLNGAQVAISVSISDLAGGLSGKLKNGDIVSVIAIKDSTSIIPPELTYVKVITTTTSKGADSDSIKSNEDGTTDLPSTVTLLVNTTQAKLLAGFQENGKLHLSLVYRGDDYNANKFLETQNKVFEKVGESNE